MTCSDPSSPLLLLNIGNTHSQLAFAAGDAITRLRTLPTGELAAALPAAACRIAAVSVVPAVRAALAGRPVWFLENRHAAAAGLRLDRVDASTLGADRLANAIELASGAALPALTVDCGTAINLEIVGRGGIFLGGAIAPGRALMRRALKQGTAQLPELPLSADPPERLGTDTRETIRLGVDRGAIGMVRELLALAERELGEPPVCYGIGGDADFFRAALPQLRAGGADFTLHGLLRAYRRHHPEEAESK